MLDAFREVELASVMKQINSIKALDVDLIICRDGIDDEARQALKDAGILAYRRVEKPDLDLLALATGASLIHDVNRAVKADRGSFITTSEEITGGVNHWLLEGEDGGATFIAKGSTPDIANEVERCFADAVGVACQLLEESSLVPGAGATQVALARGLRRYAESIPGREQLAIEAWADALEVIPRTLAENAGMDPTDSLLQLTAAQSEEGSNVGLDLIAREPIDVVSAGILDPVSVIRQSIAGANEATISVLRIDDVLWAQQDPQVPDEVQERLDAMGGFA
jgi:chaperonin GroEL (HSP60 family)